MVYFGIQTRWGCYVSCMWDQRKIPSPLRCWVADHRQPFHRLTVTQSQSEVIKSDWLIPRYSAWYRTYTNALNRILAIQREHLNYNTTSGLMWFGMFLFSRCFYTYFKHVQTQKSSLTPCGQFSSVGATYTLGSGWIFSQVREGSWYLVAVPSNEPDKISWQYCWWLKSG